MRIKTIIIATRITCRFISRKYTPSGPRTNEGWPLAGQAYALRVCMSVRWVCLVCVCVLVVMSTGQQTVLMSGIYVTTCFLLWECHKKFTNLLRTSVIRWPLVGWLWQFNCPLAGLNPRFMIRHYWSRLETIGQPKLPRVKLWTWVWIILRKTLQKKRASRGQKQKAKTIVMHDWKHENKATRIKKKVARKKMQ